MLGSAGATAISLTGFSGVSGRAVQERPASVERYTPSAPANSVPDLLMTSAWSCGAFRGKACQTPGCDPPDPDVGDGAGGFVGAETGVWVFAGTAVSVGTAGVSSGGGIGVTVGGAGGVS